MWSLLASWQKKADFKNTCVIYKKRHLGWNKLQNCCKNKLVYRVFLSDATSALDWNELQLCCITPTQRAPCFYLWDSPASDTTAVYFVLGIRTGWQLTTSFVKTGVSTLQQQVLSKSPNTFMGCQNSKAADRCYLQQCSLLIFCCKPCLIPLRNISGFIPENAD